VKFKEETFNGIYPKARDTLKEFLQKTCSCSSQEAMLCPRCSSLFDKDATKSLESSKIKIEIEKQRDKEEMKKGEAQTNVVSCKGQSWPSYRLPVERVLIFLHI
jgi:hypothetical protein